MLDDNPQDLVHDLAVGRAVRLPIRWAAVSPATRRSSARSGGARSPTTAGAMPPRTSCWPLPGISTPAGRLLLRARRMRSTATMLPSPAGAAPAPATPFRSGRRDTATRGLRTCTTTTDSRSRGARRDPGRSDVLAAVPGDPREARNGVLRLHVRRAISGRRARRPVRGGREENLAECLDVAANELAEAGAGRTLPGEIERAKENSRPGSCSRSSRCRAG